MHREKIESRVNPERIPGVIRWVFRGLHCKRSPKKTHQMQRDRKPHVIAETNPQEPFPLVTLQMSWTPLQELFRKSRSCFQKSILILIVPYKSDK